MKVNKPAIKKTSGRTLKENLERLDDAGINLGKEDNKAAEKKGVPDTKKQQQTGDTSRSDRRL